MNDEAKLMKLPVRLSEMEIHERAQEAAELMHALDDEKDAEADRRKAWKADIETRERRLRELSTAVRTRFENRPVEVEEIPSAGRGIIEVLRRDTHEVVYSRPMTDAEKRMSQQASLWDGEPAQVKTTVGAAT